MRLARPFYQLPVLFDAARLQAEVAALPPEAWASHPDGLAGNSAARLITSGGAETDAHGGQMHPTHWLAAMPYLRQVLASFGVVWSRSRLMRLAPGAHVPEHADINYHWHTRVRVHIPVVTWPQVRFHCDDQSVHMAAGEAWIFDNWRRHHVVNDAAEARIHLVADTTGTATFWRFACRDAPPRAQWRTVGWNPEANTRLLIEDEQRSAIMPAAEVQLLVDDWRGDLALAADTPESRGRIAGLNHLLRDFVLDWRQLCALHGTGKNAAAEFIHLAQNMYEAAKPLARGVVMRSNGVVALLVLEKRVLQHLIDVNVVEPSARLTRNADEQL
jgi:hypothetical protein